jgi:glyoxylase-like metal-dependent hydrolase (beta-lactamase superfamily II)
MNVFSIETIRFKVDGGAMFGVVPKLMWNKKYPADSNNLCTCACRSLLVDNGIRKVLIDTGIGSKMTKEELNHYVPDYRFDLMQSLKEQGYSADDITDVVLTHLHFDHCGGAVNILENGTLVPAFKNATFHISRSHWENAVNPNRREKPSFILNNFIPLYEAGKLSFVEADMELFKGFSLKIFNGHTVGLLVSYITIGEKTLVFTGDMMPAAAYVPLSWISAYDVQPLVALKEKTAFLKEAYENNYVLFFQHDAYNECANIIETSKGYRVGELGSLIEFMQ